MDMDLRSAWRGGLALALLIGLGGCGESVSPTETTVPTSPPDVIAPEPPAAEPTAPAEPAAPPAEPKTAAATEPAVMPVDLKAFAGEATPAAAGAVALVPMSFEKYREAVTKPDAKLTVVDAWATWCGPCKENFPHLVEMYKKYGKDGLNVVSLSMDDATDPASVKEAKEFLESQGATFTNVLLDAEAGEGFEKLAVNAIPAVFLYSPEGKEIRRFTMDDVDNQFTYEQVDQVVGLLLAGKELPADAPGTPPPGEQK